MPHTRNFPQWTATLRLRLGFNGERPKTPSLERKVEVAAVFANLILKYEKNTPPDFQRRRVAYGGGL